MVTTTLKVDGMMCGMCESHINDAIRRHFSVRKVKSSRRRGETVIVSEEPLDAQALRRVIRESGYELERIL